MFKASPLSIILIVILTALVFPPLYMLIQTSVLEVRPDLSLGDFTLEYYHRLVTNPRLFEVVTNSVIFGILSTALALIVGSLVAWVVERTDAPCKFLIYLTSIVALGTPGILKVSAWLFLFGRSGPFNEAYRNLTGMRGNLINVNSMTGMVLIESIIWLPMVFLLMSATFRAANAEMEEAARMSGASVPTTVWRISLKLAMPAVLALAMFIFIRTLEAFEVPALVGMPGKVDVLTTEIYRSMHDLPPQTGYASAFSVILLLALSVLLVCYSRISRNAEKYASITGKGYRPRPFQLGRYRWAGALMNIAVFLIVLVLPLVGILWVALSPFPQPIRISGMSRLTMDNFAHIVNSAYYSKLVVNTLLVAAGTATVAMTFSLAAGWLAARRKAGGQIIDQLMTIPLVFPGLVLGVAMLQIGLRSPVPIYGTLWLIGLAFLIRYIPYGMRYSFTGVLQIHPELEQAAGAAGANTFETLRKIVFPLLLPALTSGWIFIFLLCAKEMSLPLLLAGPNSQTIPVAMFNLWTNGQAGEVAALGLLWALALTIVAIVFKKLANRGAADTFGH
ncbi:iron ABC transporter permease (plasmid) [Sinorhizobium mexicanum]|uniref:Iron ABC transporter permease n=2 Tax=Sinorhizobium mexicanum TaxID=375549 RepID=A0A859QMG8_9HYPH|nr:iron ABC transporter permease [Sinorhizobium mexicanum]QLL66284.1 iron ABC transporter permease [Sinorhizobium mexicanum]